MSDEHAYVDLEMCTGFVGAEHTRTIEVYWMSKEEWEALSDEEKHEELEDEIQEFINDKISVGFNINL